MCVCVCVCVCATRPTSKVSGAEMGIYKINQAIVIYRRTDWLAHEVPSMLTARIQQGLCNRSDEFTGFSEVDFKCLL